MSRITAPHLRTVGVVGIAALTLTACGGDADGETNGNGEEDVSLSFTWWGGDTRHEYTQEIIEMFEAEYPHISVEPLYGEWDGYWDQLATQTAAQDTPDIVQMDLMYLREYIENGILLELDAIDTGEFTEELLDTGRLDGALYAMPVGQTALTFAANLDLFEEAGLERPDDESWTWDDLLEAATEVSENTDAYGQAGSFGDAGFEIWLRQTYGVSNLDEDGQLAWEPEDAVPYFELLEQFQEAGAIPSAAEISEERGITREQTLIATGGAALSEAWDTTLVALSSNEGVDLHPLMLPSETGNAADAGMYYKASMFYSVYAGTEHPEEAQLFVDFLVNNEEAGQLQSLERGIPGNESVRELIRDDLDDVQTRILEFSESLEEVVGDSPPLPPEGFGAVQEIIWRYEEEFLFGRLSAEEAAEGMHGEIDSSVN
ncbi:ABC transporter substrate-binding protein [Nesterenkonia alba]|uniref:ABC transporter substrate-binding protein n=1 Tax=Nesterenkonia alba TaxID=515814 RepID=UPI0003B51855|nr:ABC transporter substrate-binding protein [Nesterenkonia alba]